MRQFGRGLGTYLSVVAAVMLTAAASSARAADMAVPPAYNPPRVALPPAMYDWTGLYFGGHVGAGLLHDSVTQAGTPATTLVTGASLAPVGLIGGAQAGLNFQFAPVVLGGEVSWTDSNINGSAQAIAGGAGAGSSERFVSNPLWIATATGRVGYAANDWLFYAKGGGAVMRVGYEEDVLTGGAAGPNQSIGANRKGFTAGAGIEYGLTESLSAKLEYDFYDFGSQTYGYNTTPVAIKSDLQTLTFGLNYRLNWANGRLPLCPTC
jgi:outer membrane immunogenic protein